MTALARSDRNDGDGRVSRISGSFGDLFNIMKDTLNFTFSLRRPDDNRLGGQDMSRPSGWKGMIGQIADSSNGPWTVTAQRAEVIDWTLGNPMVDKQFFTGKLSQESLHFSSFFEAFSLDLWLAVFASIIITGFILFLVTWQASDKRRDSFDLWQSLTSRTEAAQRIIKNPKIAVFESVAFFGRTKEYLTCQGEKRF